MAWGRRQKRSGASRRTGAPRPGAGRAWTRGSVLVPAAAAVFVVGVYLGSAGAGDERTGRTDSTPGASSPAAGKPAGPSPGAGAGAPAPGEGGTNGAGNGDGGTDNRRVSVPNVIGMGLQAAQDAVQDAGFRRMTSHDATGAGRAQVWDRNWKVCSQDPRPGTAVAPGQELNFGAVKLDEICP
jgi:hypothetical protein